MIGKPEPLTIEAPLEAQIQQNESLHHSSMHA